MHIAIEGMDGAGKTSQAKAVAKKIGCEFISKSFHEMNDTSGKYDNFFTIKEYTSGKIDGVYGLRQNYYLNKIRNVDFVTDRFYISNYWSRAEDLSVEYFDYISKVWGIPDVMIILWAKPEVLYQRIYERNSKDKDLWKPQVSEKAYSLMFEFVRKMNLKVLVIDTSELKFEETTDIILYAAKKGINCCRNKYSECCKIIEPMLSEQEKDNSRLHINFKGELVECWFSGQVLSLPEEVKGIGENAFVNAPQLEKIIIPKTTISISDFAFAKSKISKIQVEKDNPVYCSCGGFLLDKSGKVLIRYFGEDKRVTIPKQVEIIGNKAFSQCGTIETLVLEENIEKIGYGAFVDCENLRCFISNTEKLTKINYGAFVGCDNLTEIRLKKSECYYTEEECIKDKNGNILYYYGGYDRGELYEVPRCEYIYPAAYKNRIKTQKLILNTGKIGSFAFEDCSILKAEVSEQIYDFGEKSLFHCGMEEIRVMSKSVPEVWENSFESDISVVVCENMIENYRNDRDWKKRNIKEFLICKNAMTACGTACVEYIFQKENMDISREEDKNLFWIMEMGNAIMRELGFPVQLYYYKSRLMSDYIVGSIPEQESVKNIIDEFFALKGCMYEHECSMQDLIDYTKEKRWVILNVDSEILFGYESVRGSRHFVIAELCNENETVLICPGRESIYRIYFSSKKVIDALQGNGQWLMCVGDRNDKD